MDIRAAAHALAAGEALARARSLLPPSTPIGVSARLTRKSSRWKVAKHYPGGKSHDQGLHAGKRSSDVAIAEARSMTAEAAEMSAELTPIMRSAAEATGAKMAGLTYRTKTTGSLARKLRGYAAQDPAGDGPDVTPADLKAARRDVKDAVRYTAILKEESFGGDYMRLTGSMRAAGLTEVKGRNYFLYGDGTYKGVNTNWRDSKGRIFEVQFHTKDSWYTKQHLNHKYYALARDDTAPAHVRQAANAAMMANAAKVRMPAGVDGIGGMF